MFNIGDLVIYGSTGVCKVEDLTRPAFPGAPADRLYYTLAPVYQSGVIYAPVDTKAFMRAVISPEELDALLRELPTLHPEGYFNSSVQLLCAHYEQALKEYTCRDLVVLLRSIRAKKIAMEQQNRRLGQIDARYMKRAEDLLYGELAVVLQIAPGKVPAYLAAHAAEEIL
ncbi:MAG: hypothetical protein E7223_01025 [Clostridiales bacterium]|nr:hypothetical protein [Clostridiales bacterium]